MGVWVLPAVIRNLVIESELSTRESHQHRNSKHSSSTGEWREISHHSPVNDSSIFYLLARSKSALSLPPEGTSKVRSDFSLYFLGTSSIPAESGLLGFGLKRVIVTLF